MPILMLPQTAHDALRSLSAKNLVCYSIAEHVNATASKKLG